MVLEITLMTISGLGMAALLVNKHLERARGDFLAPVEDMRQKADPILRNLHHSTGRFFSYITVHNIVLILNYAFVHLVKFCMDLSHKVHTMLSGVVEKASRKTEDLSRSGAASFYLKQIKESKDKAHSAVHSVTHSTTKPKEL